MKCVKNHLTGEIQRVTTTEARKRVGYGWSYVTKGEWKRSVRPDLTAIRQGVAKATSTLVATGKGGFRRLG